MWNKSAAATSPARAHQIHLSEATPSRGFGTVVIEPKMTEICSTTENRELWEEQIETTWNEGLPVQRTRSRNEVALTLICSISSEISQ